MCLVFCRLLDATTAAPDLLQERAVGTTPFLHFIKVPCIESLQLIMLVVSHDDISQEKRDALQRREHELRMAEHRVIIMEAFVAVVSHIGLLVPG